MNPSPTAGSWLSSIVLLCHQLFRGLSLTLGKTLRDLAWLRGFVLFVQHTPVNTPNFGTAMSLFRCQDKLAADLFVSTKFIILLSAFATSLITSKHKKLIPILPYMRTLVPRRVIGGIFNKRRPVHRRGANRLCGSNHHDKDSRRLSHHQMKLPISVL